jgi:integrase
MVLPKVKNARHVYLTREQALPVFRKMGLSWSRDAARVAFYTGWRISEVLSAVPVKIDGDLCLSIPDSKNDAPRIVPVHAKITHLVAATGPAGHEVDGLQGDESRDACRGPRPCAIARPEAFCGL